jgi:chemotaxis protein MotA
MDLSLLAGCGAGLGVLALALFMAHVPPSLLLNPEALLLVLLGTLMATVAGIGWKGLNHAFHSLFSTGSMESAVSPSEAMDQLMDVVSFAREEGVLALQPIIDGVELPFFRKGLLMLLDNRSERFIKDSLGAEMEMQHRHKLDDARVFETAAGYAPTMGVIGAVIGLVCVLQNLHSAPATPLGQGVAGAFIATLYGVALANLFLLPAANRLRQRARDEWRVRALLLEGVIGIHANEHPLLLQERLAAFGADGNGQKTSSRPDFILPSQSGPIALPREGAFVSRPNRQLPSVMDDDFLRVNADSWQG